jgi:hypothetical protein
MEPARQHVVSQPPGGPRDLGARAVGDAQIEIQLGAAPRLFHDPVQRGPRARRETGRVAQDVHPGAARAELGHFPGDVVLEQLHERLDLVHRALPVLLAEGEEREHAHPGVEATLDGLPHGCHPRGMPQRPGEGALPRPPAVPVHDDGDVGRDGALEADPLE